ncbi:MAG: hypothetical protein U5O39_16460 [Gammaproteobacteria bacterium]|nr:hypothetical protein [Gammaproteobacteria bacterium]
MASTPEYTGQKYIDICHTIKQVAPEVHIHAFTPLEVWQGAHTMGVSVPEFLGELREAGLGTLPGTAAEILDDEVRADLCPDKINTAQWFEVMEAAHAQGFNTTATIMFGHMEEYRHVANHLLRVRALQAKTGAHRIRAFCRSSTMESPVILQGRMRARAPSFREAIA